MSRSTSTRRDFLKTSTGIATLAAVPYTWTTATAERRRRTIGPWPLASEWAGWAAATGAAHRGSPTSWPARMWTRAAVRNSPRGKGSKASAGGLYGLSQDPGSR